jgi:hypothetical protein
MPLNDIFTVAISTTGPAPTQQGFGIPLVLGTVPGWGASQDRIRFYASLLAMTTDGIATTDPEYLAATAIFAQNPAPPTIAVGRRANKPTMRFKIQVLSAVASKKYSVFVNGVEKSFTAAAGGTDTTTTIAAGLVTAIGALAGFTVTSATDTITITATVAGNWVRISVSDPNVFLDVWQDHADPGVQADLTAILTANDTWYAIVSTFAGTTGATNTSEVGQIAAWAEANQKLYIAGMQDSRIIGASTTDIASNLKALSYARTTGWYHPDNGLFLDGGVAGKCLPLAPGSETWKFKTIAGVSVTVVTATQQTNLKSKRTNYYYSVAGLGITTEGTVYSGEYVDTIRGRDWLAARLQTRLLTLLAQRDQGALHRPGHRLVESEVRAQMSEGVAQGYLAASPAPTVSVPKAANVSLTDKQNRVLNNVLFSATLAGAIHSGAVVRRRHGVTPPPFPGA